MQEPSSQSLSASAVFDEARTLGALLVLASAAFFAMAGIFTKSVSSDVWTIACWRGLVGGLLITGYVLWRSGPRGLRLNIGWRGCLMIVVGVAASVGFIGAFRLTYVANVAVIYAATPLVAAFLEWLFLDVKPRRFTLAMAVVCLAGVGVIVSGGYGGGNLIGDLVAIFMMVAGAIYLVMIRAFRDSPVVWVGALSAFILFAAGWVVTDPLAVSAHDAWRIGCFGVTFACAVVLWTEGARLIPASEAGVLGAAEVPFAILFAWMFLAELPPPVSVAGGAIVMAAVILHALRARRTPPVPAAG